MKTALDTNPEIWLLIGKIYHKRVIIRQKELRPQKISTYQMYILGIIEDLGANATIAEIAKIADRDRDVISRLITRMADDELITKTAVRPKSRLLKIELTEKGLEKLKHRRKSKALDGTLNTLSAQEGQLLSALLNKILVKIGEYSDAE
jgi:DNA-binding MarR family transcriptional regulator